MPSETNGAGLPVPGSAGWWRPDPATEGRHASVAAAPARPTEPDSPVPFWALMSFTFILLLAPQTFFPALAPLRIAMLTALAAIATYVWDRFVHRQPVLVLTPETRLAAWLVTWAVLTVPFSYWPGGSVAFLLGVYFKTLVIFWLLSHTVTTLPRLRQVAWGLSLMSLPLALTAVQHFLSGFWVVEVGDPGVKRILGYDAPLTENPNDLALILNLIFPLTVGLLLVSRGLLTRALLVAIIVANVLGVIVTFSRAGFLTLATIVLTYVGKLLRRPQRGWALAALALGVLSVPLLPPAYLARLATITDIESDPTGSAQARWNDTVAAVRFVMGHPVVGAGVGMDTLALNEVRGAAWKEVHNAYLEYAVDLGLPGLVLFLLLLLSCLKRTRSVRRQAAPAPGLGQLSNLAEAVEVGLVGFAVAAFFYPVGYLFYFYYVAGLAVAVGVVHERATAQGAAGSRPATAP